VPATGGTSSWRSSATTDRLAVARVLGAKGLAGGLRVELLTDFPERLEAGAALWVEGDSERRALRKVEWGGRAPVFYLDGISDRSAAESLLGRYLEAPPQALPAGSYYWHQLVGLSVTDVSGALLGELVEVFRAGENEVYRVEGARGETLIPALRNVVRSIDLEAGTMVVSYEPEEVR